MSSIGFHKSDKLKSAKKINKKKSKKHTKEFSSEKLETCRVCNLDNGTIHIFNYVCSINIAVEIQNFSGVEIKRCDEFTKYLCQSCFDLLTGCVIFRELCRKNNKTLQIQTNEVEIKIENVDCNSLSDPEKVKAKLSDDELIKPEQDLADLPPSPVQSSPSPEFPDENESYNKPCSEKVKTENKLEHVLSDEDKKKQFLCDVCGKTSRSNASLLIHMTTHGSIFPFKCDECSYQGRTFDLLRVHKRSHLADKPYKCTQCPKSTTTSSNLAKHMRHVHSTTRPFQCTYCEKFFSYQHDMKRHVRDIHLRQGQVECDICYKKFNTKKILQGHRWKIHKIKGERTGRLPTYLLFKTEAETSNVITEQNGY